MYYTTILRLIFFSTCASPEESLTELAKMLDFWVQFRLNIPLMLYCGFNFVKNIIFVMLWFIFCQDIVLVSHCLSKYCLKKIVLWLCYYSQPILSFSGCGSSPRDWAWVSNSVSGSGSFIKEGTNIGQTELYYTPTSRSSGDFKTRLKDENNSYSSEQTCGLQVNLCD